MSTKPLNFDYRALPRSIMELASSAIPEFHKNPAAIDGELCATLRKIIGNAVIMDSTVHMPTIN